MPHSHRPLAAVVACHHYTLKARQTFGGYAEVNERQGVLLRLSWPDGRLGYSDCHPWQELGDGTVAEQIDSLLAGKPKPLISAALKWAELDAKARFRGQPLFRDQRLPASHYLLPQTKIEKAEIDAAWALGFHTFKIKLHADPEAFWQLSALFPSTARFRLDFNSRPNQDGFESFLAAIAPLHSRLDFCEDPYPFEPESWQATARTFGVPLACDRDLLAALPHVDAAAFLVIKPALHGTLIPTWGQLVYTTYLDHPLGQLCAAWMAAEAKRKVPRRVAMAGLTTHTAYVSNAFSQALALGEGRLHIPGGTGFGFDRQLNEISWSPLYAFP